ncbi:MAG: hypothetical protein RLZZ28_2459 [Bacteroidota bacterium]|jgi:hypothetical protein
MQENSIPVSQREIYAVTGWRKFLWWLSTAEPELLADCVIDRNRYAIVGMTVLGTWSFATLAWTYFFSTVLHNAWIALLLGLFMGLIVLTIDRALIKGISKSNKNNWLPLFFRGILALIIGLFMAQPALLYMFDKEIHVQISLDNEQRKQIKKQQQDSVYYAERTRLEKDKLLLEAELHSKYLEVAAARDNFIRETDGTGGSKKIGLKDIAEAKQRTYQQLDLDYRQKELRFLPQIKAIDSNLAQISGNIQKEQIAFETLLNDGFITRIEALNHLVKDNTAVAFRYYLLVIILLLIELMPVLSKLLLPAGTYEEKVVLREKIEKELTQKNHERELGLKELFNQTAFQQDKEFIAAFFDAAKQERLNKLKEKFDEWGRESNPGFDTIWGDVKKYLLTKQEN